MIGQYLPNKTKVVLFIGLKFFHNLNVTQVLAMESRSLIGKVTKSLGTMSTLDGFKSGHAKNRPVFFFFLLQMRRSTVECA
jgi:hypothetical protein